MTLLVVGANFRSAPLELLERLSFAGDSIPKALHELRHHEHVRECMILSTCNRVEIHAEVSAFHGGIATLRRTFAEMSDVSSEVIDRVTYARYDVDAIRHVFSVASGIDSMAVGEAQILSQVRSAHALAAAEQTAGRELGAVVQHAIRVGRRVRRETNISRIGATLATAGATLAQRELGSLDDKTILLIGAGKMTTMSARSIARRGAHVIVASRTRANAEDLARRIGAHVADMGELGDALTRADLVIASTSAGEPVVTHELVEEVMARRPQRPLTLLDLAVPRNVDPGCAAVAGVTVRDLDDVRTSIDESPDQSHEVARAKTIVAEELARFEARRRASAVSPLVGALQRRADEVRTQELRRAASRLGGLDPDERAAVEGLTRAIVAKLLHRPVTEVKRKAGSAEGEALARALRELFDVED